MSDATSLGGLLTDLRTAAGLKVPEVIAALGEPRSTVYEWHTARSRPTIEDLQRLLDLYNASPADRLEAWRLRALPLAVASDDAPEVSEDSGPDSSSSPQLPPDQRGFDEDPSAPIPGRRSLTAA